METVYLLVVIFIAYLVQSVTGFGGALLSLPITILLIGFDNARVLATVLSLFTGLLVSLRCRKQINRGKLLEILIVMAVGTASGMLLDRVLEVPLLITVYGIVTVILALAGFLPRKSAAGKPGRPVLLGILLLAGLMQGLFVAGGAFLMVYAMYELPEKTEFRATCSAVWGVLNWFMLINYGLAGKINGGNLKLVGLCVPVVLLMMVLAEKLQSKINQRLFSKLTNALLLATGVILLAGR
ncbi:MAG TPA: sulfite exporter TauE/SafE family protein [Bacillota bacterium]|jgi:uncharacterized membrane protein YfcA|nr:sulfite exporter TauE/SafE family protein [Fastidiosipila sp.]HPX93045.1 sulfite exporter TauE/SafE family protein [Bacillota bacterium]HQB80882.1 sulfite exporter TauE/SafE family protein [Bacillota bacterium]